MSKKDETLKPGDQVYNKKFGDGVIVSIGYVELPSDNDHTFYVVDFGEKGKRNLKSSELE